MREQLKKFAETRSKDACWAQCHAPYESIYFGTRGEVIACCYNRENPLGYYPEKNLREIWDGAAARQLRSGMLSDNSLPKGCDLCASQVEASNFSGLHAAKFDQYAGERERSLQDKIGDASGALGEKSYPSLMEFELSNSCNLECVMCHGGFSSSIRKNREGLDPLPNPYDAEFVRQLDEFIPHLKDSKFLGGEPFLIGIYYEIWDRMIALNPSILTHITTNGSILNPRVKRVVEKLNVFIVMSIDSLERETYNKIRINSDFDKVQESIAYYYATTKAKGGSMAFASCPMTSNWQEMPDLVRHCDEKEISIYFNTVFFPREHSLQSLPAAELDKVITHFEANAPAEDSRNWQALHDLINQCRHWRDEARWREDHPEDESAGWGRFPDDAIQARPRIEELQGLFKSHWDNLSEIEPELRRFREDCPDEFVFVRAFFYAAAFTFANQEELDPDTAIILRKKAEFLIANYENFSDRTAYADRLLSTDPKSTMKRTHGSAIDRIKLDPTHVFAEL